MNFVKLVLGAAGGVQSYLIAAGMGAVLAASLSIWATSVYYKADLATDATKYAQLQASQSDTRAASAEVSLNQLNIGIKRISQAAAKYAGVQVDLGSKLDVIAGDLQNVQTSMPLPVDCKPSPDRLRSLTTAVEHVNSTLDVPNP